MQGNQPIKLTDPDRLLSEALDKHFTTNDCFGVLAYAGLQTDNDFDIVNFLCKRCGQMVTIIESNKL